MSLHRSPRFWLVVILAAACLLRIGGLFWGIPSFDPYENLYHPDEYRQVLAAAAFPGDISSRIDLRNPTLPSYLAGAIAYPLRLAAERFWRLPTKETRDWAWLVARILSLLFGLGGILATFFLGRRMVDAAAGLLAAGLVAVASYHVQLSAFATNDVASACLMVCAMLLVLRLEDRQRMRDFLLAGVVVGLLLGTRYTGVVIGFPLLIIAVRTWKEGCRTSLVWTVAGGALLAGAGAAVFGASALAIISFPLSGVLLIAFLVRAWIDPRDGHSLAWMTGGIALLAAAAAVAFLITTPAILLHPENLAWSISSLRNDFGPFALPLSDIRSWRALVDSLGQAMGVPMLLVVAAGILSALVRPRSRELFPILSAAAALSLAFIPAGLNQLYPRYLVMVLPLLIVPATGGILRLARSHSPILRRGVALACIVVVAYSIVNSAWAVTLRWNDPRSQAAVFIERKIPAGSSVGYGDIGDYRCPTWYLPKIDGTRFEIVDPLRAPGYLILSSVCFSPLLDVLGDPNRTLDALSRTTPLMWGRLPWTKFPQTEVFQFADDVLREKGERYRYRLMRAFGSAPPPVAMEFAPPEIRIYQSEIPRND